jgi:hypothetical protein
MRGSTKAGCRDAIARSSPSLQGATSLYSASERRTAMRSERVAGGIALPVPLCVVVAPPSNRLPVLPAEPVASDAKRRPTHAPLFVLFAHLARLHACRV